jgi:hypothetical protein
MKKSIIIVLAACGLMMMAGCATYYHTVQTMDGKEYVTHEEPEYDKKTQSYTFTDVKGDKIIINREQIKVIEVKKKNN